LNIGIVSDSHDNVPAIDAAVAAFREREAEALITRAISSRRLR